MPSLSMADEPGYPFAAAAQILDLPESRLRYWSQVGFVGPSLQRAGKQAFSFQDLVSVKAAKELTLRGVGAAQIRKALDTVRSRLVGLDRPIDRLRLAFDGTSLLLIDDGAAFEPTGQRVFDFGLAELAQRAASALVQPIAGRRVAEARSRTTPTAYDLWKEGLHHEGAGGEQKASDCYARALKLDPGLAAAHTNQGALAYKRGDLDAARAAFSAALALDPDQPEARYNLACLIFEVGDVELAAAQLRRVLQSAPDMADAHFNLAAALEHLGSRRQARAHLMRFLALVDATDERDGVWAEEARARLDRLS